jgi:hypothetical protein
VRPIAVERLGHVMIGLTMTPGENTVQPTSTTYKYAFVTGGVSRFTVLK